MRIGRSGSEWSDLKVVVCVSMKISIAAGVMLVSYKYYIYILIDLGSYAYTAVLYGRDTSVHFL